MLYLQLHDGELTHPITALEDYFRAAGVMIIQAAFAHSYFIHPDAVREKTPFFPERARFSRQHYPGLGKDRQPSGQEMDGRYSSTTTSTPNWPGRGIPVTGSPAEPATPYGTSGATPGTRTISRTDGTSVTCPSGQEC